MPAGSPGSLYMAFLYYGLQESRLLFSSPLEASPLRNHHLEILNELGNQGFLHLLENGKKKGLQGIGLCCSGK